MDVAKTLVATVHSLLVIENGEVVSEKFHIPNKAKEAVSYRLGNGKYIQRCRQEIETVAKGRGLAMPILFGQVLSGEVQTGDVVKFADIAGLKRELKFLERAPKFSATVCPKSDKVLRNPRSVPAWTRGP